MTYDEMVAACETRQRCGRPAHLMFKGVVHQEVFVPYYSCITACEYASGRLWDRYPIKKMTVVDALVTCLECLAAEGTP